MVSSEKFKCFRHHPRPNGREIFTPFRDPCQLDILSQGNLTVKKGRVRKAETNPPNILDARKPCQRLFGRGQEIVNPNLDYIRRP